MGENGSLCGPCWKKISFIGGAGCEICGLPFPYDHGAGALCGACARQPPDFDRAQAVMVYNDHSRGMVLSFKHGDRTFAAKTYANWMVRVGEDLIAAADLIAPVPLHWTRLFYRRYNQAALLANIIGKECNVISDVSILRRKRRTQSQGRKSPDQRRKNLQGAFVIPAVKKQLIADRHILLIDDVMTTGATVAACARVLRRAGAGKISVLTLSRVVRADHEF